MQLTDINGRFPTDANCFIENSTAAHLRFFKLKEPKRGKGGKGNAKGSGKGRGAPTRAPSLKDNFMLFEYFPNEKATYTEVRREMAMTIHGIMPRLRRSHITWPTDKQDQPNDDQIGWITFGVTSQSN